MSGNLWLLCQLISSCLDVYSKLIFVLQRLQFQKQNKNKTEKKINVTKREITGHEQSLDLKKKT